MSANLAWNQTNNFQAYYGETPTHPSWFKEIPFVAPDDLTKAMKRTIRIGYEHVAPQMYTSEKQRLAGGWKAMEEELAHAESIDQAGRYEMPSWDQWKVEFCNWWEVRKPGQKRLAEMMAMWNPDPYGEAEAEANNWYKGLRKWAA